MKKKQKGVLFMNTVYICTATEAATQ